MAQLTKFRVDSKLKQQGEWITLPDFDGLRIKTRGYTDQYVDARAARLTQAARHLGGDQTKIPNNIARKILVDCLIEFCLLDVDELVDEAGQPIAFPAFCDLLRHPDYGDLVDAASRAASQVGRTDAADLEDAVGNSRTPAGLNSNGDNTGT